jgi:hypothetical protein
MLKRFLRQRKELTNTNNNGCLHLIQMRTLREDLRIENYDVVYWFVVSQLLCLS